MNTKALTTTTTSVGADMTYVLHNMTSVDTFVGADHMTYIGADIT